MNERAIVEAALFSAGKALTVDDLARTTRLAPDAVREHLRDLARNYAERGSAIEVAQIGTKWTMQIRSEFAERARSFAPPEIERDLLKTAALIAYHQPILQSHLFDMIGSKVYEHTKSLEELGLVNRKPSGRSLALTTTRYFAEFFGLKSTDREGIRELMAQKAGVPYTERPAGAPSEDVEEPTPSSPDSGENGSLSAPPAPVAEGQPQPSS
jgi:segregation and condensation protein B